MYLTHTRTSCHALNASHKLINPGDPLTTVTGSWGSIVYSCAGFWCGFMPYLRGICDCPSLNCFLK